MPNFQTLCLANYDILSLSLFFILRIIILEIDSTLKMLDININP